ncbi:MAG TPA: aldehyde dehydrogenase family protein [Thermodesulfobacteriota bacterium]
MQTNWIDNRSVASESKAELPVLNPATEEVLDTIPKGAEADVAAAVEAARRALPAWRALSPTDRKKALRGVAARLGEHKEEIARLLTLENGKPLGQAKGEVEYAVDSTLAFAELAVHLRSGVQGARAGDLVFQHREPRGVCACIVPWNYPLAVAMENIAPALAVGNTVVVKPSEKTPLSTRLLVERAFAELPAGVVNVVLGDGPSAGEPLVRHPGVDVVVFVGSERTGRRLGQICGETLKKCVLELGGKDPFLVDDTVDVRAAARLAADAAYTNAGQICTSTERLYVQRGILEPFVAALAEESRRLRIGSGLEPTTQVGPLVDSLQLAKVERHVADAVAQGAEVVCGGARLPQKGFFFPPTVLLEIRRDMLLMREETFGPLAPIIPFDDWDEAIALANDCAYGLAAIVCTTSAPRAIKAIQELQAGMVKINTTRGKAPGATSEPFKASGLGHGYGVEIMYELTRQKSVHWRGVLA